MLNYFALKFFVLHLQTTSEVFKTENFFLSAEGKVLQKV